MAQPGDRPDIEQKIECIANRIVRGKLAKKNWDVKIYRLNRDLTVLASALGSAGLGHPILTVLSDQGETPPLSAALAQFSGLTMWISIAAGALYVAILLGKRFYQSGEVEKRAIQSLAAFEVFDRLEVQLAGALEVPEPLSQLSSLHEASVTLEMNYKSVLPDTKTCKQSMREFLADLVNEKSKYWRSRMPKVERRKR